MKDGCGPITNREIGINLNTDVTSFKKMCLKTWHKSKINSFANLIESDFEAVKNAIIYNYSNGVTEGFNNKTKVIKRQMYGRCGFELLRLKILA